VKRHALAVAASIAAAAAVTGLVYALRPVAPDVTLGTLYVFAVVPVALAFGLAYAVPVSVASMLLFNFLFLPPLHSFTLRDSENWTVLATNLVTAVAVSHLAASARRRAAEAERRERQATLLAAVAIELLEGGDTQRRLRRIAVRTAEVLGVRRVSIELGSLRRPGPGEEAHELRAGDRRVGTLFLDAGARMDSALAHQLLPALASLLAIAQEREQLAGRALETESLRRADAIKTAILRAVSHDLRSPLTAIRAAGEGLASRALDLTDADRAELLETIVTEARRLDRLVANLLDLSRLEAGAADPRPELRTVDDLVARALDGLGPDGNRVRYTLPPASPLVRVDPAQIERVVVNLLENALKFSPPASPVEVAVEHADGEVVVRVRDHGPGLTAGQAERVFEPFLPGRQGGGQGLGLAIAQAFAQANGSRVWAEPAGGAGTVFSLAMPAAEPPARGSGPVEGVWGNREVPPSAARR
jgi:two-component system, OmpR family, sensor histidine kinase KdpD